MNAAGAALVLEPMARIDQLQALLDAAQVGHVPAP
jgi:hypothetical protein